MEITVQESGKGKYAQDINLDRHLLTADEPIANGGNDLGPSPYDFLLASLGACTSMTLRIYADLKKIPLEKVIVRLTHDKIHAEDCKECEEKEVKMDHIDRKIELFGNLSQEQREKW